MQGLGIPVPCHFKTLPELQVEMRDGLTSHPEGLLVVMEWNGCLLLARAVHSSTIAFKDSTHVLS